MFRSLAAATKSVVASDGIHWILTVLSLWTLPAQFDGYVTSDSGAISDEYKEHKYVDSGAKAAAISIAAGTDINSGSVYSSSLGMALAMKLVNESSLDDAVGHSMRIRMRLGLFDPPEGQPVYGPELVGSAAHHQLSYEASLQGLTLLKNEPAISGGKPVLPLARGKKLAVIGGNAETKTLMAGGTGGGLLSAEVVCLNATSATDWWCIQVIPLLPSRLAPFTSTVLDCDACALVGPFCAFFSFSNE